MNAALFLLKGGLSCAAFVTLWLLSYTVTSTQSGNASYLGLRGLQRSRAERDSALFRQLEPTLRWLGAHLRGLLSDATRARIDRQIMLAGDFWGLLPEEAVALTLVSLLGGLSAGAVYGGLLSRGPMYIVLAGMVGVMLPYLQLTGMEQERRNASKTVSPR